MAATGQPRRKKTKAPSLRIFGPLELVTYCWWFRNPACTSWGWYSSLSHYIQGFRNIPGGAGFLPSTVSLLNQWSLPKHDQIDCPLGLGLLGGNKKNNSSGSLCWSSSPCSCSLRFLRNGWWDVAHGWHEAIIVLVQLMNPPWQETGTPDIDSKTSTLLNGDTTS